MKIMGIQPTCLNCGSKDLKRIKRTSYDRIYSFLHKKDFIVKRFSCLACFWEGRISRRKSSENAKT